MDCGPASLKCLLEGFGTGVSYGRLREACQTGIDGTSIDTMEKVADQLRVDAEQIMLPVDHLLLSESNALPAIVVVTLPNGMTHFVVAWRRHGRMLQVMDPAVGRRWVSCRQFESEIYIHTMPAGRATGGNSQPQKIFRRHFKNVWTDWNAGIGAGSITRRALDDESWRDWPLWMRADA